ncbi:MAG: dephospho-CoA kinase, partial [Gammaproteobacteria bacterium]
MFKVGLTGGIGCGKTTILELFKKLSVPVLDADQIAHQLVGKGQPALVEIERQFGADILMQDGSLDRSKLKEIIFSDARQKQKLEAIIHPLVFQSLEKQLEQLKAPYCLICIPLLFETHKANFVDRILVVDCPVEIQIERVTKRDRLPVEFIKSIIASQVPRAY